MENCIWPTMYTTTKIIFVDAKKAFHKTTLIHDKSTQGSQN